MLLILLTFLVIIIVLSSISKKIFNCVAGWISLLIICLCIIFYTNFTVTYFESFYFDFNFLILLTLSWSALLLYNYQNYSYILFITIGVLIMITGINYHSIYIGIELITLSLILMIGSNKITLLTLESMIKYFIISALSSGFFLFGISIIYYTTGSLLILNSELSYYSIGYEFIQLALLLKLGMWPVYGWYLDILGGCSLEDLLIVITLPKIGIYAILNLFIISNWFYIIWIGTSIIGCWLMWQEYTFYRLIGSAGLITETTMLTLLFLDISIWSSYIFIYYLSLWVLVNYIQSNYINSIKPLFIDLIIILWAIAGVPPLLGFYVKWWAMFVLFYTGYTWIAVFLLSTTLVIITCLTTWFVTTLNESIFNTHELSIKSTLNSCNWFWLFILGGFCII